MAAKLVDNKTMSALTRFAFRNPNGITYGYATFDLLLQNSSITKLCFVIPTERSDEESLLLITRFLTSVRNDRYAIVIALSTLTTFAVRNPRGATCSCTTRDPLLQRLSKLRFHLSSFIFALFSVLCLHLSFLPKIEKCTYLFGCSFRSSRSAVAAEHVLLRLL